MNQNFIVSPSPHVHSGNSIPNCMYNVLIALIPAFLVSLYFFGVGALVVTLTLRRAYFSSTSFKNSF